MLFARDFPALSHDPLEAPACDARASFSLSVPVFTQDFGEENVFTQKIWFSWEEQ